MTPSVSNLNCVEQILAFLSSSPELLSFPGQRLDASAPAHGYVEQFQDEIKQMEKEMLEQEQKELHSKENFDWDSVPLSGSDDNLASKNLLFCSFHNHWVVYSC